MHSISTVASQVVEAGARHAHLAEELQEYLARRIRSKSVLQCTSNKLCSVEDQVASIEAVHSTLRERLALVSNALPKGLPDANEVKTAVDRMKSDLESAAQLFVKEKQESMDKCAQCADANNQRAIAVKKMRQLRAGAAAKNSTLSELRQDFENVQLNAVHTKDQTDSLRQQLETTIEGADAQIKKQHQLGLKLSATQVSPTKEAEAGLLRAQRNVSISWLHLVSGLIGFDLPPSEGHLHLLRKYLVKQKEELLNAVVDAQRATLHDTRSAFVRKLDESRQLLASQRVEQTEQLVNCLDCLLARCQWTEAALEALVDNIEGTEYYRDSTLALREVTECVNRLAFCRKQLNPVRRRKRGRNVHSEILRGVGLIAETQQLLAESKHLSAKNAKLRADVAALQSSCSAAAFKNRQTEMRAKLAIVFRQRGGVEKGPLG